MSNRQTQSILAISAIALIIGSSGVYLNYSSQQSLRNDLQGMIQDVQTSKQVLSASAQRLEALSAEISSLRSSSNSAVTGFQKSADNLGSEIRSLRDGLSSMATRLSQEETISQSLASKVGLLNSSIGVVAQDADAKLAAIKSQQAQVTPEAVYQQVKPSVVVVRVRTAQGSVLGSGFFYAQNQIITNYHVIQSANSVDVELFDGSSSRASIIGQDPFADVAVLRVESPSALAKPLQLANSSALNIGQPVLAVGNPLGLTSSLTSGIVSQMGRLIGPVQNIPLIVPVIQLDILIAPGNSGGPLLDLHGNVVGVTNAGIQGGVNFAIPSNIVKRVADSIIKTGKYEHPFVGYTGIALTSESIRASNIADVDASIRGIMIVDVLPNTPAQKAGLIGADKTTSPNGPGYRAKDIVVSVDGRQIRSFEEWSSYMEEKISPGQTITLGVLRSGVIVSLTLMPTVRA